MVSTGCGHHSRDAPLLEDDLLVSSALREGNISQWAIAEVLEQMHAVCKLCLSASLGATKGEDQ
jgi:hypothetical protein